MIAEAEGVAKAEVTKANARAEAMMIKAKGHAESLKMIAEGEKIYLAELIEKVTIESATQIILAQKYIDGMKTISDSPSAKVFLPSDFKGTYDLG